MIKTGKILSNDFELGYQIEGHGPNILIIGGSVYYPRILSENLRNHFRLIFSDMRAFAPPPRTEFPLTFTLDLLLDDIEHLRQELQLGQVIIFGHSGNAFLALEYAKKYPENVSHVVMIATSPNFSDESKISADKYWQECASADRKNALEKQFELHPESEREQIPLNQQFIWNYLRHTPRIWYDFTSDYSPLWQGVHINTPIFDYVWGELFRDIDITRNLGNLDKPVFLGLGRHDFIVSPPNTWDPLRSKFSDIFIHVFEHSGHSPFYEEAPHFDSILLNWITTH